ncbi:MAG: phage holin family protein [Bacteroidaceae bacterium]|nr:phage holin family protein [Bacteroidaceae bacterium]
MYKIKWSFSNGLYATWGAIVSFTQDIQGAMLGLIVCIGIDTLTGFIAAPYRGQVRKSAKLKAVVGKIITYSTAIISLHILETLLFPDYGNGLFQLAKCACSLFGGLEIYSTLENLYDITGLKAFKILTQFTLKKVEEKTGIELPKGK